MSGRIFEISQKSPRKRKAKDGSYIIYRLLKHRTYRTFATDSESATSTFLLGDLGGGLLYIPEGNGFLRNLLKMEGRGGGKGKGALV